MATDRSRSLLAGLALAALTSLSCSAPPPAPPPKTPLPKRVRFATFNVKELSRQKVDELDAAGRGTSRQLARAAEIVQRVRPDVLLINEIDFDDAGECGRLFHDRYLAVGQGEQAGIEYAYSFVAPVNTGVPSGLDLDHDGASDGPEDAWGFGRYPGQYGMALYSRLPIDLEGARTFRLLPWSSLPGNLLPDGREGKPAWYPPELATSLRLSSKSHWDVPVTIDGRRLHLLASHPTPPAFDGEEDRNGRRNHDEIRLWRDYLSGGEAAQWIVDDRGVAGGLDATASFVLLGDLNADPFGDASYGRPAIYQLLDHPRVFDPQPRGPGGALAERPYAGDASTRTSDWGRLDYVLPSSDLIVAASGVYWPLAGEAGAELVSGEPPASDHRLVWVDIQLSP